MTESPTPQVRAGSRPATPRPIRRETFLSGREILDRVRAILGELGDQLDRYAASQHDPRVAWLLSALEHERIRLLETTLQDFETTAPRAALDRMTQYSAEIPESMFRPTGARSPDAFASWIAASVDRIGLIFDRIADASENEEVAQVFGRLAERIRGHARRIARIAIEGLEIDRDGRLTTSPPDGP